MIETVYKCDLCKSIIKDESGFAIYWITNSTLKLTHLKNKEAQGNHICYNCEAAFKTFYEK